MPQMAALTLKLLILYLIFDIVLFAVFYNPVMLQYSIPVYGISIKTKISKARNSHREISVGNNPNHNGKLEHSWIKQAQTNGLTVPVSATTKFARVHILYL